MHWWSKALPTSLLLAWAGMVSAAFLPEWGGERAALTEEERVWIEQQPDIVVIDDMRFRKQDLLDRGFTGNRWTNSVLYYQFDPGFPSQHRALVRSSLEAWREYANVRFVESSSASNRVLVVNEDGCWSYVGMIGGVQKLSLRVGAPGEGTCVHPGVIRHEFAHALGMQHEQSRSDRNNWVEIVEANVEPDRLHNFNIVSTVNYTAYDYHSVMHYGSCAFGVRCPTIRALPRGRMCTNPPEHPTAPGASVSCDSAMGNRSYLSRRDLMDMAHHYGTTLRLDYRGRARGSVVLRVGSTNCSNSCSPRVPYQGSAAVTVVQANGPVLIDGCRARVGQACTVDTATAHARIPVRYARDAAAAARVATMRLDRIFTNGFEALP